jgi:hypothetical protein
MKADNGTSSTFLMLNSPCTKKSCSVEAKQAHRRIFKSTLEGYEKFLADDEDLDDSVMNSLFEGNITADFHLLEVFDTNINDYAVVSDEFSILLQ